MTSAGKNIEKRVYIKRSKINYQVEKNEYKIKQGNKIDQILLSTYTDGK